MRKEGRPTTRCCCYQHTATSILLPQCCGRTRDVGLLLQRVLHVASEELPQRGLVVVLDEREREHVEKVGRAGVRGRGELVEQLRRKKEKVEVEGGRYKVEV